MNLISNKRAWAKLGAPRFCLAAFANKLSLLFFFASRKLVNDDV
jgi:hypothetical protein